VRLEAEEIRQPVFAAKQVGNRKDARRQKTDLMYEGILPDSP
jgi:hypothetical protein